MFLYDILNEHDDKKNQKEAEAEAKK